MGHRQDAIEALRAYARDVETTINGGAVSSVGSTSQDDAAATSPAPGAPHLLAVSAVAASVVLVGAIAISGVIGMSEDANATPDASPTTLSTPVASGPSSATAVRALNEHGLTQAAQNVLLAMSAGIDESPAATEALEAVFDRIDALVASGAPVTETDSELAAALAILEEATRPPGLDTDRLPPGQGGTPPGQDPTFTPPGQDPTFTPPGQGDATQGNGNGTTNGSGTAPEAGKP
jgi:hypothetical protein